MKTTTEVLQAEPRPSARKRALQAIVSLVVVGSFLVFVLPRLIGTTGHDVGQALTATSLTELALLTVVWMAGIFAYSFVLTGSLPGLTRGRALTLNLTGSSVSNMLPFGGAAGMSLNYLMIRGWGMDAPAFAAFTVVTNVWIVILKLLMPVIAAVVLVSTGITLGHTIGTVALVSAGALGVVVLVIVAGLASRGTAVRATAMVVPVVVRLAALVRRHPDVDVLTRGLLDTRDQVAAVMRQRWAQLSAGMLGYSLLQAVLLWGCLHAVGAPLAPAIVLAAYAVDRVLTMAVVTPGAAGFVEAGTAATLVALGGDPAAMAAAVLLYRAFTFAIEIPVGLTWLGGWAWATRRVRRAAAEAAAAAAAATPIAAVPAAAAASAEPTLEAAV